jgi:hypothetical protein
MAITKEIDGSTVACETLDVREGLTAGALTVGGVPITPGGGSLDRRAGSEYLEDFVTAGAISMVVDVAPGSVFITAVPSARGVGFVNLSTGGNGGGLSVNATTTFSRSVSKVGMGPLTLEWVAKSQSLPPILGTDFTVRMTMGINLQSGGAGPGECLGFTCGVAENGNSNWWAVLGNLPGEKFNTLVAVDFAFHTFTIVHDPTIPRVQWFIDDVLTNTFMGVPPVQTLPGPQPVAICANIKSLTAGNNPGLLLDYMFWRYEFSRPF